MEINLQHREKQTRDPAGLLDVHSIWETIQGEGPFVGCPAVFVRLAGCNLQCPFCDTDYTSKRETVQPAELVRRVSATIRHRPLWRRDLGETKDRVERPLIVITGGEPFRQNLLPFVRVAVTVGYRVQVETNGTYLDEEFFAAGLPCSVVCSPKALVLAGLWPHIHAVKYVVHKDFIGEDGLPTKVLGNHGGVSRPPQNYNGIIYIQPLDVQDEKMNKQHLDAAIKVCQDHGYRLCIQIHKIIGVP